MPTSIRTTPDEPGSPECQSAFLILRHTHDTAESMLEAWDKVREARNAVGTSTDEEQDLLRAMLVFASSGLDAVLKQLIADALPNLIERNKNIRDNFREYVRRRLSQKTDSEEGIQVDVGFLAAALAGDSPKAELVNSLVEELRSGSLQSFKELNRIASFLGVDVEFLNSRNERIRSAFKARNRIIHEMDIDFDQPNRNRFSRTKEAMISYCNSLLEVADKFLREVDDRFTAEE